MKLDLSYFIFMTNNDYRVLTGIEMGMKNHEYVPTSLISSLSNLRREGINRVLRTLLQNKLIVHKNVKYDGYKLTYLGYDYLALKAFTKRGSVKSVGMQIGVGKESDIFICKDSNGELKCLKIHRLGRVSFRTIKNKRDYYGKKTFRNWLYLSKIAATKEYAYLKALFENNFPVPVPFDLNRHMIVMSYVNGFPLAVAKLRHPLKVIDDLINTLLKFAKADIIHGDFNEFNILIDDDEKVTIIDFPQIVSLQHENAAMYFDRDMQCIVEYFCKKYRIDIVDYPTYEDVININSRRLIHDEEHITKNEDSLLLSVLQRDNSGDELDENENDEEEEEEEEEEKVEEEEEIEFEDAQEREGGKEKNKEKEQGEGEGKGKGKGKGKEVAHTYKVKDYSPNDDDNNDDDEEFNSCNESVTYDLNELSENEEASRKKLVKSKKEKEQIKEKQKEEMKKTNIMSDTTEDETPKKEENTDTKNYSVNTNIKKEKTQGKYAKENHIKESLKREDVKEEMKKEKQYGRAFLKNMYKSSSEERLNNIEEEEEDEDEDEEDNKKEWMASAEECVSTREPKQKEILNHYVNNGELLEFAEESEVIYSEDALSQGDGDSVCNDFEDGANSKYNEMEITPKEMQTNDIRHFQKNNIGDSMMDSNLVDWEYIDDAGDDSICSSGTLLSEVEAENEIECDKEDELEDHNELKEKKKHNKEKKHTQEKYENLQKKNKGDKMKNRNMNEDEKKSKNQEVVKKNKKMQEVKSTKKGKNWNLKGEEDEEEEEEGKKKRDEDWDEEFEKCNSASISDVSHYSSCNSSDCEENDVPNKLSGTWTPHIRKYTKEYVRNKIKYMNKKKSCKEKYKNSLRTKTKNAAMEKIKGYI